MPDLQSEADVRHLVDTFYEKVNADDILSPVFNDFAKVDWDHHLPRMYGFWNSVLFARGDYKGNPFMKHIPLPVGKDHFERWLALFVANMDEHFEGPMAEDAKQRARSIAHIFQNKLAYMHGRRT